MKLALISEVDITKTGTAGKIGTEIGKSALGAAVDLVPGAGLAEKAGKLTMKIIELVKTKRDAQKLMMQAMSLPDNDREELNIFDIDDNLWGPEGILNDHSKAKILKLVKTKLGELIRTKGTLPPDFANKIAITFIKSKLK